MASVTKTEIKKAVKQYSDKEITSLKPLSKGHINEMYAIKLKGGKELIFRAYNEKWKARKEEFVYLDIAAHIDVPIPDVYEVDDSLKHCKKAYMIMSKLPGDTISRVYKKTNNKKLFEQAGEILAKLHHVKLPKFGWIVGNQIHPAFHQWKDFVWHDISLKMERLCRVKHIESYKHEVEQYFNTYACYLQQVDVPSLCHRDFHPSHILAHKGKITGIFDVEWALAGHTESDFLKLELWTFTKYPKVRDAFFRGYLKQGYISDDYHIRKKVYELWHWVSMINISLELNNKTWLKHNLAALKKFLR